jgi:hypothetical protein
MNRSNSTSKETSQMPKVFIVSELILNLNRPEDHLICDSLRRLILNIGAIF